MRSHELARKLLALPDKEVVVVCGVDGAYTTDKYVKSDPWADALGNIRIHPESGEECGAAS